MHRELDALDIDGRQRLQSFASLSPGEQTRCLLAALFVQQHSFALIDEPTNHLDLVGRALVAEYLAGKPGFILVSHDRAFLDDAADHVVALTADGVTVQHSNYSTWRAAFEAERAARITENERLKRQIARLVAAARQRRDGADAREADKGPHMDKGFVGHRAAKQMKRALNIERRAEVDIEARRGLVTREEKHYALRFSVPGRSPRQVVVANNLCFELDDGRTILDRVSLTIEPGDRLAIIGPNGAGKSTLLDIVCGVLAPTSGDLVIAGQIRISRSLQEPQWHQSLADELDARQLDESRFPADHGGAGGSR